MIAIKSKKGFTLIELMVVITIIGILAVGGTSVYTSQLQKSRDAVRMTDVKAIQAALTQYNGDNNRYPKQADSYTGALLGFLGNKIPKDPKFVATSPVQCNTAGYTGGACKAMGGEVTINLITEDASNYGKCTYAINTATSESDYDSYKVSAPFENQSNITNKSTGDKDGGCVDGRFEVYAGSGANNLKMGVIFQ